MSEACTVPVLLRASCALEARWPGLVWRGARIEYATLAAALHHDGELVLPEDSEEDPSIREGLVRIFSWSIPSPEALEAIAQHGPVLEVMAGTGYWSSLLHQGGVDVIATDLEPYTNGWCDGRYTRVEPMDAREAAARHPDRALLMSWPPPDDPVDAETFCAHFLVGGAVVILISEVRYGSTGSDAGRRFLAEHYEITAQIPLPSWKPGRDVLTVYHRKDTKVTL